MHRPAAHVPATLVAFGLLLSLVFAGCPITGGTGGTTFNLPPTPVITSNVTRGVAPLSVDFSSERSTDDGFILERDWDFGDGATSQEIAPTHTYNATGDYTVTLTLTDDLGATATREFILSVTEAPVAVIDVSTTVAESAPAVVEFDGSASFDPDGTIVTYRWDFGDGSSEFLQNVTHVYAAAGTFRAKLTVTDEKGITGSAQIFIQVGIPVPSIEIRVPPANEKNIVVSKDSPLWIQAVYEVEPGTPRFVRAGIDGDTDICDAQAVIYDLANGAMVRTLFGHTDRVTDVVYSIDGNSIFTASDDNTVRRYSNATGALLAEYEGTARINTLAISPDDMQIVWGQVDGTVILADVTSEAILLTMTGHNAQVEDIQFSPDGTQILSGSSDRRALLWNVADGTVLRDLSQSLGINGVAFSSADPTLIATASEDGTVKLWNLTSGAELLTFDDHSGPATSVIFSPDGLSVLSGSADDSAILWDAFDGSVIRRFDGHDDDIVSVAFNLSGDRVLTGCADGSAKLWDAATGTELETVQPCDSEVSGVAFSPSLNHFVISVAARNGIQLDVSPSEGEDLNITYPQPLRLRNVPSLSGGNVDPGSYYLWAEIDTDRSDPVRTYAEAVISVISDFTDDLTTDTPTIPFMEGAASVIVPASSGRYVFDLGQLNRGDQLFVAQLNAPGFGEFYTPIDPFSLMVLNADGRIFAWYEALRVDTFTDIITGTGLQEFILFTPDTRLVITQSSPHYYIVSDGGANVSVQIDRNAAERQPDLLLPVPQRVLLNFEGASQVAAGNQDPRPVPPLDAANFNEYFMISPAWGEDETEGLKQAITNTLQNIYGAYDLTFYRSDDLNAPALPYVTIYFGDATPDGLLGVADYVDPRNVTTTGTAIVYASEIAQLGINGFFTNDADSVAALGAAMGRVAAKQVGHLMGLRNTDDPTDVMQTDFFRGTGDPTIQRILKTALVTEEEMVDDLPLGPFFQDANQLLADTVGLSPDGG